MHFNLCIFNQPALYTCRDSSTNRPVFLQNEPNFRNDKPNATSCTPCHSDRRHASSVPKRRNLFQYSRYLPNRLFGPACQEFTSRLCKTNPISPRLKPTQLPVSQMVMKTHRPWPREENEPNRTQSNPICPKPKMTLNLCPKKHYGKVCLLRPRQNKPNQTRFPRTPGDPCGCGGNKREKIYFFQNPVVTTIELPQTSYILVRRLSIDRRSCGALMGGPAPISKSGGGIPTRGSLGRRLARWPGAGPQNRCGGFSN